MGILARGIERRAAGNVWERWVQMMDMGGKSKAGPSITTDSIFRVSAAFACMREISQGLAQVPFKVMQDYRDGGLDRKKVLYDHPVHRRLNRRPNSWQTAFEFIETIGLHASLGNAYVYKGIYRGQIEELIPLHPGRVSAKQNDDGSATYTVRGKNGEVKEFDGSIIWHLRGASFDGFMGLDLANIAKEALGLSIALEESHASLHANGIRPSGVYSVDGTLNEMQHKQLTAWLKKEATAPGGTMVLDRNAKWLSTAMSGLDSQHLETRQLQIEEVCRFFGVIPTIVGYTGDKANTYASAEVAENAHKVRTQGRWYKRVQDSANINLLSDKEMDGGIYTKFVTNALMAASAKDRGEFYGKALGSGGSPAFMTQDEVRALEDMDPMGGEAAKLPPLMNKQPKPADPITQDA